MTTRWGGTRYDDLDTMLAKAKPDVVYVAVPPYRAVAIGERLVQAGIPFLTEKPLAASDAAGPARLAAAIERAGLVVAVGYHLRALDILTEVREWLDGAAAEARGRALARFDAASGLVGQDRAGRRAGHRTGDPPVRPGAPADGRGDGRRCGLDHATSCSRAAGPMSSTAPRPSSASTAARSGPSPTRAAWRRRPSRSSSSRRGSSRRSPSDRSAARATGTPATTTGRRSAPSRNGTDPYERQAAAFLDAVKAGDPGRVLSTYADALKTDRLTRAVVAATGRGRLTRQPALNPASRSSSSSIRLPNGSRM